jgi:hypothetical protein
MKCKVIAAVIIICCVAGCKKTENPVSSGTNHDPVILAFISMPDSVEPGKSSLVEVFAADSDGDNLTYEWESPGIISRSASQKGSQVFYTPNSCCGEPKIKVTVKDNKGGSKDTVITVWAKGDY